MEKTLYKDILKAAQQAVGTVKCRDFVKRYPEQEAAAERAYVRAENAAALQTVPPTAFYNRFYR